MGFLDSAEKFLGEAVSDIGGGLKWGVKNAEGFAEKTEGGFTSFLSGPLIIISVGLAYMLYNSNVGQVADATKNVAPLMM